MDSIRQYLISIITAAIICGGISSLAGKKGTIGAIIKFLCGIFMTITVISPWVNFQLPNDFAFWETFRAEAQASVAEGESIGAEMRAAIITDQMESYVLDKAEALGLSVTVEISVDEDFLPKLVIIHGAASPYARSRLRSYICDTLGITEDRLTWT